MKTLYLDLVGGISGDMFLGAMIDLGLPLKKLEDELNKLGLHGYHLHAGRQSRSGIEGIKFDVHIEAPEMAAAQPAHSHGSGPDSHPPHAHPHGDHGHSHPHPHTHPASPGQGPPPRSFADIEQLIRSSSLPAWVRDRALATFQRIAVAEGKIHGEPPQHVHFHEVGALDSIVDIVGAAIALDALGRPRILASPVVDGHGWVDCAHGRFPVPTLATLEILGVRGIPVSQCEEPAELVTPTGAALLAEWAEEFGPMQQLAAEQVGYGLGSRSLATRPNVLRAVWATSAPTSTADLDWESDTVVLLETNLDDASPELLGHFMNETLAAGALDVYYQAVQMKKNRPGILLSVLCRAPDADRFTEALLRRTTAFGVRRMAWDRRKLRRDWQTVQTAYGEVRVKRGLLNNQCVQWAPEYESCKRAAAAAGVPLQEVFRAACRESLALKTCCN